MLKVFMRSQVEGSSRTRFSDRNLFGEKQLMDCVVQAQTDYKNNFIDYMLRVNQCGACT